MDHPSVRQTEPLEVRCLQNVHGSIREYVNGFYGRRPTTGVQGRSQIPVWYQRWSL